MTTTLKDLLTLREVAAMYAVSKQAVWKWVTSGRLPAERLGNQWVVRRADATRRFRRRSR